MATTVRANADLRDTTTNSLVVPKGTEGVVAGFTIAPQEETYNITFTVDQTTVMRWVTPDQITFLDGPLGPVKAVLESGTKSLTSVSYPKIISDTDLITAGTFSAQRSIVDFVFSDGTTLRMTSDLNTGDIRFEFIA